MKKIKVPKKLSKPLLDWILDQDNLEDHFELKPPSHKGYVVGTRNLNNVKKELVKAKFPYTSLKNINLFILEKYGLELDTPHDTHDGIFLSYSTKGHSVHMHQDKNPDKKHTHVRFNLLLNESKGGDPILGDMVLKVNENEVWVCIAGNIMHGTTEITGKKPRIMVSFGHYVKNKILKTLV